MNQKQRDLAAELQRLDPQLATLYEEACRLAVELNRLGAASLVAHAARELSRGVIAILSDSTQLVTPGRDVPVAELEANRARIARVLGLPPDDSRVTRWFELVNRFAASNKFRQPAADGTTVVAAFLEFSEILFGLIGPYFDAQAVLDELLRIEQPSSNDVARVGPLLGRPALRRYFYSRLEWASWLPLLEGAGLVSGPPEARWDGDGRVMFPVWAESVYLIRVAAVHPELVTAIFERVPANMTNMMAWRAAADASLQLPGTYAARLARRIGPSLRRPPEGLISIVCIDVVRRLAELAEGTAFELFRQLLSMRRSPSDKSRSEAGQVPSAGYRGNDGPVLEALDRHDLAELLKTALPSLIAFDAPRTLESLIERLLFGIKMSPAPPKGSPYSMSKHWCRDLENIDDDDDPRAQLAGAIVRVAREIATKGEAISVLRRLSNEDHEIFRRAALLVLAEAGEHAPDEVDSAICTIDFLDAPWGNRESAALVRSQFNHASRRARSLLVHAITQGPDIGYLNMMLKYHGTEEPEPAHIAEEITRWQRSRLLWFEGAIPIELRTLADQLGIDQNVPSVRDRRLAYDGYYSEGVTSRGYISPLSLVEIEAMNGQQLAEYLAAWAPTGDSFNTASREGLANTLERWATANPAGAGELIREVGSCKNVSPSYIGSILQGWRRAMQSGVDLPWPAVFTLMRLITSTAITDHALSRDWRWVAREAMVLLQEATNDNRLPQSVREHVWEILTSAIQTPETWNETDWKATGTFEGALAAGLNTYPGQLVEALLDLALATYRDEVEAVTTAADEKERAANALAHRLAPLIEEVLNKDGLAGAAGHVVLGWHVPQLWLLVREWFAAARPILFHDGVRNPIERPLWGAYLVRSTFYSALFPLLRPWYTSTARELIPEESTDPHSSPSSHLVEHIVVALLRGDLAVGEPDALVETTFDRMPIGDRTHAYWLVHRGWSDADSPVEEAFLARLIMFWEWRLQKLETGAAGAGVGEEASGLLWFLVTPYLPGIDVLRLADRTLKLATNGRRIPGLWKRLADLTNVDLAATLDVFELAARRELAGRTAYIPVDEVKSILLPALSSADTEIRDRARRFVHELGERHSNDFRQLLAAPNDDEKSESV